MGLLTGQRQTERAVMPVSRCRAISGPARRGRSAASIMSTAATGCAAMCCLVSGSRQVPGRQIREKGRVSRSMARSGLGQPAIGHSRRIGRRPTTISVIALASATASRTSEGSLATTAGRSLIKTVAIASATRVRCQGHYLGPFVAGRAAGLALPLGTLSPAKTAPDSRPLLPDGPPGRVSPCKIIVSNNTFCKR